MRRSGFSLLEVLLVSAIIALLFAAAIPSYQGHVFRARRAAAVSALLQLAERQEEYFFRNGRYAQTLDELGAGEARVPEYALSLLGGGDCCYVLSARALGGGHCAVLSLDERGRRSAKNGDGALSADCW